jgi:hypothetical protein
MIRTILYLSDAEEQALRLFAQNKCSQAVYELVKVPYIGIWPFVAGIRRKTGIREISYPRECIEYIQKYEAAMLNPQPLTENERYAIVLLLDKNTYDGMCYRFKMDVFGLEEMFESAKKKMGIFTQDEPTARLQYKLYLAAFHGHTHPSQMSFPQEQSLRHWANGKGYAEIADLLRTNRDNVKYYVKDGCTKLGVNTRGRGTQRALLFSLLQWQDAQKPLAPTAPVSMDDPMF